MDHGEKFGMMLLFFKPFSLYVQWFLCKQYIERFKFLWDYEIIQIYIQGAVV